MIWLHLKVSVLIFNILFAVIDVFIISYIFYRFYQILAQTKAVQVIKGLLFFVVLYLFSRIASLATFSWVLNQIAAVIVLAIIILFQPEIRRVLVKLGQSNWINSFIKKNPRDLSHIINAIQNFQILRIGALIVFERNVGLKNIVESGTVLNSRISTSLLITIFTNKTPLHDGAVLIKNDVIVAAGCFLPLSDSSLIKKDFGTRHRAALGMAEDSDAVVVVVSEETGKISIAYDGKLYFDYEVEMLKKELSKLVGYEEEIAEKDLVDEKL